MAQVDLATQGLAVPPILAQAVQPTTAPVDLAMLERAALPTTAPVDPNTMVRVARVTTAQAVPHSAAQAVQPTTAPVDLAMQGLAVLATRAPVGLAKTALLSATEPHDSQRSWEPQRWAVKHQRFVIFCHSEPQTVGSAARFREPTRRIGSIDEHQCGRFLGLFRNVLGFHILRVGLLEFGRYLRHGF